MTLNEAIKNHLDNGGSLKDTMGVRVPSEVLRLDTTIEVVGQLLKGDLPVVTMVSRPGDLYVQLDF